MKLFLQLSTIELFLKVSTSEKLTATYSNTQYRLYDSK